MRVRSGRNVLETDQLHSAWDFLTARFRVRDNGSNPRLARRGRASMR